MKPIYPFLKLKISIFGCLGIKSFLDDSSSYIVSDPQSSIVQSLAPGKVVAAKMAATLEEGVDTRTADDAAGADR